MSLDYRDAILDALDNASDAPGDFCTGGPLTSKPPQLDVQVGRAARRGSSDRDAPAWAAALTATAASPPPPPIPQSVGRLALPLSAEQAQALAAVATPAPCGKGTATLLDPTVRRSLQLEPAQLAVANGEEWGARMARAVKLAAEGLGLPAAHVKVCGCRVHGVGSNTAAGGARWQQRTAGSLSPRLGRARPASMAPQLRRPRPTPCWPSQARMPPLYCAVPLHRAVQAAAVPPRRLLPAAPGHRKGRGAAAGRRSGSELCRRSQPARAASMCRASGAGCLMPRASNSMLQLGHSPRSSLLR